MTSQVLEWVSRRIRNEREFCVDDLAMQVCEGREVYAQSLITLAEVVRTPPAYAMSATGGRLVQRIRRVMLLQDEGSVPGHVMGRTLLIAVATIVCLGCVMAVAQNRTNAETERSPTSVGSDSEEAAETVGQVPANTESTDEKSTDSGRPMSTKVQAKQTPAERMREALEQSCQLELIDEPLVSATCHLVDVHGVNIVLDWRALYDAGLDFDTAVDLKVTDTLAGVLDKLTEKVGLTWCVRYDVIFITSRRDAQMWYEVRVYRMRKPDPHLARAIIMNVSPESWADTGGPGSLKTFGSDLLVINQTYDVHRRIEKFFADELQPVPRAWKALPPGSSKELVYSLNRERSFDVIEMPLKGITFLATGRPLAINLGHGRVAGRAYWRRRADYQEPGSDSASVHSLTRGVGSRSCLGSRP